MSESQEFTVITSSSHRNTYEEYEEINSDHAYDFYTSIQAALRRQYPELNLTIVPGYNVPLLTFAALGNATAELDISTDSIQRLRLFENGNVHLGIADNVSDFRNFAKYHYRWAAEDFIIYVIENDHFILKEPGKDETTNSHCAVTDALILAAGQFFASKVIYVYDGSWEASRSLWDEVQKASWEDVILNEQMKKDLTELMTKFFNSKDIYLDLGIAWKRGIIFHGPAGNGKTISIKALMHSLSTLHSASIPALYVKYAPSTWDLDSVFGQARALAPCMLIFEDIDTIVTKSTRSYFFNEVDGLENNDGIFIVASTNHLDQLDPGLSKRPSRFDRKYLFPLPDQEERTMYCEYWRRKLQKKPTIKFPRQLCPAIAGITQDFSFAYLKEAFVSTLVVIAGRTFVGCIDNDAKEEDTDEVEDEDTEDKEDKDNDNLDKYELWREIKIQVMLLRQDMDQTRTSAGTADTNDLPRELRGKKHTHSTKYQGYKNQCGTAIHTSFAQDYRSQTLGSHRVLQIQRRSFPRSYHDPTPQGFHV